MSQSSVRSAITQHSVLSEAMRLWLMKAAARSSSTARAERGRLVLSPPCISCTLA